MSYTSHKGYELKDEEDLENLITVLMFYAEPENWESPSRGFQLLVDPEPAPVASDGGAAARLLLDRLKKGD